MPDEQNVNTPVATEPAPTETAPAPDTDALQKQVGELSSSLEQHKTESQAEIAKRDALLQQYQVALGNLTQQQGQTPAPKKEEPSTDSYDDSTKQYVTQIAQAEAKRIVDEKAAQMVTNAEIHTRLGDDKQVLEEARKEYATLKQNPSFANLPDYAIQAMAVDRAKSTVFQVKSTQLQEELSKSKGEGMENTNTTGLPSTSPAGHQARTLDPNDPDADLKDWMNQRESQVMFRAWQENKKLDPFGEELVREGGRNWKAKDLFKQYAIRAVRKGVAFGGGSGLAIQEWSKNLSGGVR